MVTESKMYFVNWQRIVSVEERGGMKVVVKRTKSTALFNEGLLASTYVLISILLGHPSSPPFLGRDSMIRNEGRSTRKWLAELGVPTPSLVHISEGEIVEEFIDSGNLYAVFSSDLVCLEDNTLGSLARAAGRLTGKLHLAGYVFVDNKAQNYLINKKKEVFRTDLAFLQKQENVFSRSMDIGSFLASVVDLDFKRYQEIESGFFEGYKSQTGHGFPYLTILLRNILAVGFSSDHFKMIKNMLPDAMHLLEI